MKLLFKQIFLLFTLSLIATSVFSQVLKLKSPDSKLLLTFELNSDGQPSYTLSYKDRTVIAPSLLGYDVKSDESNLHSNFEFVSETRDEVENEWNPVWGEYATIKNHYKELKVTLKQKDKLARELIITFRLFNDGLGFRYTFPKQNHLTDFIITKEYTQFNQPDNKLSWWIPADYDTNEYSYRTSTLSNVHATKILKQDIFAMSPYDTTGVQTPFMMKDEANPLYINIHEAALVNFPAMDLHVDVVSYKLSAQLVPGALGNKAYITAPFSTPWRTIIVSDKAEDILASTMIQNLNEPNTIKNTDWIKPTKYIGVWWEMFAGKGTWDYAGTQVSDMSVANKVTKHAANNENVKKYIDFASKYGFDGVLVEGWNTGWEDWFGKWRENIFDFVTPYPDFDVEELNNYAKSKNTKLIMHNETSGDATNYERQIDTAYQFMNKYGYAAVKTGYVGKIIPRGEHHYSQWMVNHYLRTIKKAVKYKIMINMHEPVKPTGLHRTYPNFLACESARGMEYNAFGEGNQPEHETILPFTRFMGGPMDFTPGIFRMKLNYAVAEKTERVRTTLAKQLALYVIIPSPIQMAADLPEHYEEKRDAFQFILDVPVDWSDTKILKAEPGEYTIIARKDKASENWYLGGITDEESRTFDISLDFLTEGKKYKAIIYEDAKDASWDDNPEAYHIREITLDSNDKLPLRLAKGGGIAIEFVEK